LGNLNLDPTKGTLANLEVSNPKFGKEEFWVAPKFLAKFAKVGGLRIN